MAAMYAVDREAFETMVQSAVAELPAGFRERIVNLDVAVDDWAERDDYAHANTPHGSTLLGVYRGVPLPNRTRNYHLALPDQIVIFQQPLQRLARDEADLYARVRRTVRHEIAHYFGISDERLRDLGAY